jgi:hypothetical protein
VRSRLRCRAVKLHTPSERDRGATTEARQTRSLQIGSLESIQWKEDPQVPDGGQADPAFWVSDMAIVHSLKIPLSVSSRVRSFTRRLTVLSGSR